MCVCVCCRSKTKVRWVCVVCVGVLGVPFVCPSQSPASFWRSRRSRGSSDHPFNFPASNMPRGIFLDSPSTAKEQSFRFQLTSPLLYSARIAHGGCLG
eukprot:3689682-Pyramimonas_sp.AAC.2